MTDPWAMHGAATLHILLTATLGGLVVLVALVALRKARRDRRETRAGAHRDELTLALRSGSASLVPTLCRIRGAHAETDLAAALDIVAADIPPDGWACLQAAAAESGLVGRLRRRTRSRSLHARGRAALVLGRLDPEAPALLADLLTDSDPDVRLVAAASVARSRAASGLTVLVDALAAGLVAPARVVELIGEPWAVAGILERLPRADAPTRAALARALGLAGVSDAVPALLAMLENGSSEERISAARALGTSASISAREPLERALRDELWPLRAQAAKALGAIGATESVPALAVALSDPAWWVRDNAASALSQLGAVGEAALRAALHQPDRFARERASQALTRSAVRPALRAAA